MDPTCALDKGDSVTYVLLVGREGGAAGSGIRGLKTAEGRFKNNQRDDFLSGFKVGKVKRFVFGPRERESPRPRRSRSALHKPPIKLGVIAP